MSLSKWALLLVGAALILVHTSWWYRTREEPVRARLWAAVFRASALLTAWLILLDPVLPFPPALRREPQLAILDASYSMLRATEGGEVAWRVAIDSAARYDGVWLFGETPIYRSPDSLPPSPLFRESLLSPALRAAGSAGARQVTVVTDGGVPDAREAVAEANRQGLMLSVVQLDLRYGDVGVAEIDTPVWAQAGDTVLVEARIVAARVEIDSVRVEIVDADGVVRAARWTDVPQAGRFGEVELTLPIGGAEGYRRYSVRAVVPGDPEPRNDQRVFYVRVAEGPSGAVLVSLRPDWEPSFLLPNLDRVSDAPSAAYLWLSDSLVSLDGYRSITLNAVRQRARAASLLVLHGFGADAPEWARNLAANAERVLIFAAGGRAFEMEGADVRVGRAAAGEWYADGEVPPSPLALGLQGISLEELPPLVNVRQVDAERFWTPLTLRRLRRGEPTAAVALGTREGRRWAVALAEGYWRWAIRPGNGRQLYRALWTGVAGWLTTGERGRAGWGSGGLDPVRRVIEQGGALVWHAPDRVDSLTVELRPDTGGVAARSVISAGDSVALELPPGRYQYDAAAHRDGRVIARARGPAEVEAFSAELVPRVGPKLDELLGEIEAPSAAEEPIGRRRLSTLGWPFLFLIGLFCAEWLVRRRGGLR